MSSCDFRFYHSLFHCVCSGIMYKQPMPQFLLTQFMHFWWTCSFSEKDVCSSNTVGCFFLSHWVISKPRVVSKRTGHKNSAMSQQTARFPGTEHLEPTDTLFRVCSASYTHTHTPTNVCKYSPFFLKLCSNCHMMCSLCDDKHFWYTYWAS